MHDLMMPGCYSRKSLKCFLKSQVNHQTKPWGYKNPVQQGTCSMDFGAQLHLQIMPARLHVRLSASSFNSRRHGGMINTQQFDPDRPSSGRNGVCYELEDKPVLM